jgi:hypothetical protein
MSIQTGDLSTLSKLISSNIDTYLSRLSAHSLQPPTLSPAPPLQLDDKPLADARTEIIKACERIIALVTPPVESLLLLGLQFHETTALKIAHDLNIAAAIPLDGTDVGLDELAELTGGSKEVIGRF